MSFDIVDVVVVIDASSVSGVVIIDASSVSVVVVVIRVVIFVVASAVFALFCMTACNCEVDAVAKVVVVVGEARVVVVIRAVVFERSARSDAVTQRPFRL